jgi:hypothetical protein
MKHRYLLCPECLIKIRTAEAMYKRERRLKIKGRQPQVSGKVKITKKK